MPIRTLIEAAANRFNVARCDLDYLIAHAASPGVTEMLNADDDYDYFGSLAEHECHLARLAEVRAADDLIDTCIGLRDCGYHDPSVVPQLRRAAEVVGDPDLIQGIAAIDEQDAMVDAILFGYNCANAGNLLVQMDGSAIARFPIHSLAAFSEEAAA
ncbi:hypothetical protein [Sulfitobacter sabulilitoris]|uniref:Uncharacterized protein n=1 Tax=Sulfitobacter sabulilitoris TaxID=2562655 RepID=A0A5S3PJX8_9RHOB|nr:hypothetical protein [Sulfitobacter sabulilitoris]TMM54724.1 hypothetical protein FDT80_03855 [Sulfitobacter sabulilitoris]